MDREEFDQWLDDKNNGALKKEYNTEDDPIREYFGRARVSHPKETKKLISELNEIGVEVAENDLPGIVYQPRSGRSGRIRINKDASYSALLHEYTHAMDD